MSAPDVLTVGELMIDVRVPADALAAGHVVGEVTMRPGGSAASAAAWAAAAGARTAVVGRVGRDFAGIALVRALEACAVEPLVVADPEAPTGVVVLLGERVVAERGANARLVADDLPGRVASPAVLVSGYALLHEDTEPAATAALTRAPGPWIAVDAASGRLLERYGAKRFLTVTRAATVLFANEAEMRVLTGRDGAEAAQALAEEYRVVCVKRGPEGALAFADGSLEQASTAHPVPVSADVSGAGDAFAGTLLAALVHGDRLGRALERACEAGAASLQSPDGWPISAV